MKTDVRTQWAKIIAKCNDNEEFRRQLLANPIKVMREHGLEIPSNININVIEQKSVNDVYMILPLKGFDVLNDSFLKEISAGGGWGCDFREYIKL